MPPRASDSFKFKRWDQDSIRGGIQLHPGIDQFGAARSAVPRTNRRSLLARREAAFGSEGRGFESPRARHTDLIAGRRRGDERQLVVARKADRGP